MHIAGQLVIILSSWLRIQGVADEENRNFVRATVVLGGVAIVLRIVFWAYTGRYWEDSLITCLHSENMASGLGLTHVRPGEPPLHGFTSPLSVLVPLIGDLIHVGFGIEFLKLVSIPASALTVLYLMGICIHPSVKSPLPLAVVAMGYAAVEHHQILWGMAGMETQLAVLILVMSIYYTMALDAIPLGISLGLCMLVRPDYAFWTIISGMYVFFRKPRALPSVVAVALAVYLPWIVFTTLYYGSPVPNTVIAKGLGYQMWYTGKELTWDFIQNNTCQILSERLYIYLGPVFAGHGLTFQLYGFDGPDNPIANAMFGCAVIGVLVIVLKREWSLWPLVAVAVSYSVYYVYLVPVIFGWYKVPYTITMLLLSLRGLQWGLDWIKNHAYKYRAQCCFAVAYLALFICVLPFTFHTERMIQSEVENKVRKQIGLYLKEHMKPDEAVACEPLGYVGYYSRGNVYDWPGLASRKVVAWSKSQPPERRLLQYMCMDLSPEYLLLRDFEYRRFKDPHWIKENYHVVKVFAVDPAIRGTFFQVDRNVDTIFRLYKKNRPGDLTPYDMSLFPIRRDEPPTPKPSESKASPEDGGRVVLSE